MNCMINIFLLFSSLKLVACVSQLDNVPPSMVSSFKGRYYMAIGKTSKLDIECRANGSPQIKYRWFRGSTQLFDQQNLRIFENGTMSIRDPDIKTTFDTYYCEAENNFGVSQSRKFEIQMAYLNSFPLNQNDATVTAAAYSFATILCHQQPECEPKSMCKYEWKKGETTENGVIPDNRIAVDSDGNLHFLYTLPEDETTSSTKLSCGIFNTKLNSFVAGSTTVLQVPGINEPTYRPPDVRFSKDMTVLRGQRAELQCIIAGYPEVFIEWVKPNGQTIGMNDPDYEFGKFNNDRINKRILVIKKALLQHEGQYKCVGVNTNPADKRQKRIQTEVGLNVTGPPEFIEQMKDQVVPVGNKATFTCKTKSMPGENPPERPVWSRNGERITEFQQKYSLQEEGTVLTINNVEKKDMSTIQCTVKNADEVEFTSYADVILAVIDPLQVQSSPPASLKIMPGEVQSLYVEAVGDPQFNMEYNWNFTKENGDGVLTEKEFPPEMLLLNGNKNLTLDASDLESSQVRTLVGTYMVAVGYTYDWRYFIINVTTDMSIPEGPREVVESASFDYWIIAVVLGIIFLIVVIALIVCMIRYNKGGDYPVDKKELAAGHDPEQELKDSGFHDLSRADGIDDEKLDMDRISLNASLKGYDSDEDDLREYGGDLETSKFNEDGSFIGLYGDAKAPSHSYV